MEIGWKKDVSYWPRLLTRLQAASYIGATTDDFNRQLADGLVPAPIKCGPRGAHYLMWDRQELDEKVEELKAARRAEEEKTKDEEYVEAMNPPLNPEDPIVIMNAKEAAAYLKVSTGTLSKWKSLDPTFPKPIGNNTRMVRYLKSDLDYWLKNFNDKRSRI